MLRSNIFLANAERDATMTLHAWFPEARAVHLIGEFNNWSTVATPMHPTADGSWHLSVPAAWAMQRHGFFVWPHDHSGGHVVRDRAPSGAGKAEPALVT